MSPRDFPPYPFRAKSGSREIIITGMHYCGMLTTEGHGLALVGSITPNVQFKQPEPLFGSSDTQPRRREWKLRGSFKQPKLSRRQVYKKAQTARAFLKQTLREPLPARVVINLARKAGINEWSLRRAKKCLCQVGRLYGMCALWGDGTEKSGRHSRLVAPNGPQSRRTAVTQISKPAALARQLS